MDEFISTTTMGKEWGTSSKTILRLIKSGELPGKVCKTLRGRPAYKAKRSDWETFKKRRLQDVA